MVCSMPPPIWVRPGQPSPAPINFGPAPGCQGTAAGLLQRSPRLVARPVAFITTVSTSCRTQSAPTAPFPAARARRLNCNLSATTSGCPSAPQELSGPIKACLADFEFRTLTEELFRVLIYHLVNDRGLMAALFHFHRRF